jgi:hypothetical protein
MKILFLNHQKSQCGIYEIGKRIFELLDKSILNPIYLEASDLNSYLNIIEEHKPDVILYNFYVATLPYVTPNLTFNFKNIKHIGIIHDPLSPSDIHFYDNTFDSWIIHDHTNQTPSNKKYTTIRPIRRYEKNKKTEKSILNIGSHGFSVSPWKMFDRIIDIIHEEFDEVNINMNITQATFGGSDDTHIFNFWKNKIIKSGVNLNITNQYFETENEVIEFLSKNDLNVYFYNAPSIYVGVGGSADLAISSQTSLAINSTHMYRHLHESIGYYEQFNSLKPFLNNSDKVKKVYEDWNPQKMTQDYKFMIERTI